MLHVAGIKGAVQDGGLLAGAMVHKVESAGCLLACADCPTPELRNVDAGRRMSAAELLKRLGEPKHVRLCGGEPLIWPRSELLASVEGMVRMEGLCTLTIQTSGAVDFGWLKDYKRRLGSGGDKLRLSVAYKLPSSGVSGAMHWENYLWLGQGDEIRLRVASPEDMDEGGMFLASLALSDCRATVLWQPSDARRGPWLECLLFAECLPMYERFDMRIVAAGRSGRGT